MFHRQFCQQSLTVQAMGFTDDSIPACSKTGRRFIQLIGSFLPLLLVMKPKEGHTTRSGSHDSRLLD